MSRRTQALHRTAGAACEGKHRSAASSVCRPGWRPFSNCRPIRALPEWRRRAFRPNMSLTNVLYTGSLAMIVRLKVQDAEGQALSGVAVKLTGCGDEPATTGANGLVQFLTDEGVPTVTITINGAAAWTGPSAELREAEVFEKTGSGFARK
jgi:hypothetical protein